MTHILKTELKIEEVQSILRDKFQSQSSIREWKAEEIGKGKGFLSHMVKISLLWDPADPKLPGSVMAKIPDIANLSDLTNISGDSDNMADMFVSAIENLDKVHNCEVAVYKVLSQGQSPICIPKVWEMVPMGGERIPFILMEDLSEEAGPQDTHSGLNIHQLFQIAEQLASLHAWSLSRDDWKHPDIKMRLAEFVCGKNQEKFEKDMDKFLKEVQSPKWVQLLGQDVVDNAHKLLVTKKEILWSSKELHHELGIPDVLVHGDFWNNNILVKKDASGTPNGDILAFVDWQISHPGSPAEDFVRVMMTSVSAETRRNQGLAVFKHYYSCLEAKLGGNAPYSFAQFLEAYEKYLKVAAGCILPMVPAFVDLFGSGAINSENPEKGRKRMSHKMRALMEDALKVT